MTTDNERRLEAISTEAGLKPSLLGFYFDLIQTEQRKRWNVPDWRHQPWIDADFTNASDIAFALRTIVSSAIAGDRTLSD